MVKFSFLRLIFVGLVIIAVANLGVSVAFAAAPANDDFANATIIGSLPFSDSVDNTQATTEPGEPQFCNSSSQTIWYAITPAANAVLRADTSGSSFGDTILNVYRASGPGFGGLSFLGCGTFGGPIVFNVQAGMIYYLQAGSIIGGGGSLHVNLQQVPPPPNDNFSNATVIPSLPFNDTVDTSAASKEVGEPTASCASSNLDKTVWYAFTPTTSGSVSANVNTSFTPLLAAYTGNSLSSLTELGCRSFGGPLTFHANAGSLYYVQVGGFFGDGGSLQFHLEVTPPPVASFFFSPGDPSIFDTIQFFDQSFDPGGVGFQSEAWNLGDGSTATGCCPTHQYAKDGDYTVQLTVTTFDGRTASTSPVVHVKTHDVTITKFSVPQSASAGQTRQIVVGLNSKRYPETVQVQLFKSTPNGYDLVGTLSQSVPVRPANRTTDFNFSYTFTSNDATLGKVTFKAVATIIGARDALPADNETTALPTKVTR